ncbi:hypothetical protein [Georgenia faecalis]|uniref:hypothetical protein n=1 Tax=Georgenia faecalis TaxID=2483799 RepID=UPI0013E0C219|nr:hypothetical protein [Georgenia faecalis]
MSDHVTTPAPASTGGCAHCDSSVPHEHTDIRELVVAARERAARTASVTAAVAAAVLAVALVAGTLTAGIGLSLAVTGATVAGWAVVAGLGVLVAGALQARGGEATAVVTASLTTAALAPLAALAVSFVLPGEATAGTHLALAAVAGASWLGCTAVSEVLRARTWRRLLVSAGGEAARAQVLAGEEPLGGHGRWLAQGAVMALAVAALAVVPLLVVVLVPLAVAVAALTGRRR